MREMSKQRRAAQNDDDVLVARLFVFSGWGIGWHSPYDDVIYGDYIHHNIQDFESMLLCILSFNRFSTINYIECSLF